MPGAKAGMPLLLPCASAGHEPPLAMQANKIVPADALSAPMIDRCLSRMRGSPVMADLPVGHQMAMPVALSVALRELGRRALIVIQTDDGTSEGTNTKVILPLTFARDAFSSTICASR